MPTFRDPISLDDVDINDENAIFYIIKLPGKKGFKFCGTMVGGESLSYGVLKLDPETRVESYWRISIEEVRQANQEILFPAPKNQIRSAPFKNKEELNKAFNFKPGFGIEHHPKYFFEGLDNRMRREQKKHEEEEEDFWESCATPGEIKQAVDASKGLFTDKDIPIYPIKRGVLNILIEKDCREAIEEHLFTVKEFVDLSDVALARKLITPTAINAMRDHVFSLQDILRLPLPEEHVLMLFFDPRCLAAIKEGLFTVEQFFKIEDKDIAEALLDPRCLQAIRNEDTTIDLLLDMDDEELEEANRTSEYPRPSTYSSKK